jgi:hypothetical protein
VAKAIYGAGSDLSKQWARERHDELDAGAIEAVLCALRVHSPKDDEARKCVDYVDGNRARMRYAEFRAAGLCTSTGVVESGCKTAIGTRCKRSGMHLTVAGADAIIALRCCKHGTSSLRKGGSRVGAVWLEGGGERFRRLPRLPSPRWPGTCVFR